MSVAQGLAALLNGYLLLFRDGLVESLSILASTTEIALISFLCFLSLTASKRLSSLKPRSSFARCARMKSIFLWSLSSFIAVLNPAFRLTKYPAPAA